MHYDFAPVSVLYKNGMKLSRSSQTVKSIRFICLKQEIETLKGGRSFIIHH